MNSLLRISNLTKLFNIDRKRHLHALDDISFDLEAGGSIGIVGESGSGKSTLARLIARLDDPTSGTISYQGSDISTISRTQFKRHPARRDIQLIFQDPTGALNPAFTIERNIAIGLGHTFPPEDSLKKVRLAAAKVGLSKEQLSRKPHELSGGQQARAGIARAIISEPKLLILDEPTASLDVSVQATVLKLIDEIKVEQKIALLFVSHDLDVVRLMCEEIMVLYLGRILEFGRTEDILTFPKHPYTQALIAAMPGNGKPVILKGEPTSPINPPPHTCNFESRCPMAIERCRQQRPDLIRTTNQQVACHLADHQPA